MITLYNYAHSLTDDEDLASETFVKLLERGNLTKENIYYTIRRIKPERRIHLDQPEDFYLDPFFIGDHFDDYRSFLTSNEFNIIYFKFVSDWTFSKIGKELSMSKQLVFHHYKNALAKVKKYELSDVQSRSQIQFGERKESNSPMQSMLS